MIDQTFGDPTSGNHSDGAGHKKYDDAEKNSNASGDNKNLEEKARQFYTYVVETARNMDKRTVLLAKQKIDTKAKKLFGLVVGAMRSTKPHLVLAKDFVEKKARLFFYLVVEMVKQINLHNFSHFKEWLNLKSRELVHTAMKLAEGSNYRRILIPEARGDAAKKYGRTVVGLLAVVMMVTLVSSGEEGNVRGRSLAAAEQYDTVLPPKPKSLHPKWQLWNDMTPDEQKNALDHLIPVFERYGTWMGDELTKEHTPENKICEFVPKIPSDICQALPSMNKPCSFLSIGVHGDAKFEKLLAKEMECRGFAVDAGSIRPAKLSPLVTFQNLAVPLFHEDRAERMGNLWNSSVPAVQKFLNQDFTDVLRLDCEGCEIAMIRDILVEDPSFFKKFGQVSVMKYASKAVVETKEDLYYFGLMFPLLEEAGFSLVSSRVRTCRAKHEDGGCRPELNEWGYACGQDMDSAKKQSRSCQDLLFVKDDLSYRLRSFAADN